MLLAWIFSLIILMGMMICTTKASASNENSEIKPFEYKIHCKSEGTLKDGFHHVVHRMKNFVNKIKKSIRKPIPTQPPDEDEEYAEE